MDVWQPQLCKFSCKESFEAPKESIPKTVFWNLIELMHIFQKIFLVQNILKMFCVIFPVCIRTTVIFSSRYQPNSGWTFLGLLTDGGGGGGGGQKVPLSSFAHILQLWNLAVIPYLKKIYNIYESSDTLLEFCWNQHFFNGNQEILLYQEIQICIMFWCIISNSFNFSWVFKDCFNKYGYNFDEVSKNGYTRHS